MKGGVISGLVILLLVCLTAANSVTVCRYVDGAVDVLTDCSVEDTDVLQSEHERFERLEPFLSATLSDDHLHGITDSFIECITYSELGEIPEAEAAKNRLLSALNEIKRFSTFNIKSIL